MPNNTQSIEQLFDPKFAQQHIAEHAPEFAAKYDLSDLVVTPLKRNIGEGVYHVVIRYDSSSLGNMPVFCSAHSQENRKQAYEALLFINEHGFKTQNIFAPKPLFFDTTFKAFFYQGVEGDNLLTAIKKSGFDLSEYLDQTAHWIAQLHQIDTQNAKNFNPENSRIQTIIPGPDYFLTKIKRVFPQFHDKIKMQFERLVAQETRSLAELAHMHLIHGDFHPENVIINDTDGKISVIDFTDICLGDWARDVGNFLQQLEFMSSGFRTAKEVESFQAIFVEHYCAHRSITLTNSDQERIRMYQTWSALRSAIYFLTKEPTEPKEATTELEMVRRYSETTKL